MSAARRLTTTLAVAALCAAAPRPARADEAVQGLPKRWYGWQILIADVPVLTAMTAGAVTASRDDSRVGAGFFYGGFVASTFTGVVVHSIHMRKDEDTTWKVGISLALRVLVPATGLLAGLGIGMKAHCVPRDGCLTGVVSGMIAGSFVGAGIDIGALAWEVVPPKPAASRTGLRLSPSFGPMAGGWGAGITGTF